MVLLPRSDSRRLGSETWIALSNGIDGPLPRNWPSFLRSTLPKSGYTTEGWVWKPDRDATSKMARQHGNTVFIDEQFEPYTDQWAYLSSVRRMPRTQVDALVREAESKGRIVGIRVAMVDEEDVDSLDRSAISHSKGSAQSLDLCRKNWK